MASNSNTSSTKFSSKVSRSQAIQPVPVVKKNRTSKHHERYSFPILQEAMSYVPKGFLLPTDFTAIIVIDSKTYTRKERDLYAAKDRLVWIHAKCAKCVKHTRDTSRAKFSATRDMTRDVIIETLRSFFNVCAAGSHGHARGSVSLSRIEISESEISSASRFI